MVTINRLDFFPKFGISLLDLKKLTQRFEKANHSMCEKHRPGLEETAVTGSNLIVKISDNGEVN